MAEPWSATTRSAADRTGRVTEAITVGATNSGDFRIWYSNHGSCLDLFAPGDAIRSAWYTSDTGAMVTSGTSMAAPHVAGAAANLLQGRPYATPQQVRCDTVHAQYRCGHDIVGGNAPMMSYWFYNGLRAGPTGYCTERQFFTMTVEVIDQLDRRATGTGQFYCYVRDG